MWVIDKGARRNLKFMLNASPEGSVIQLKMRVQRIADLMRLKRRASGLAALAAAVLLAAESATAATYYVDFSAGSDANAGTSTGAAFKRCPGDPRASGNAASTVLAAGDTVRFKGGVAYEGGIVLNRSGAVGNMITYDGNAGGTWGTGPAVIDNNNSVSNTYGFDASTFVRHIAIRGFTFRDIGGYATLPAPNNCASPVDTARTGTGIDLIPGCSNVVISGCVFSEIGEWQNVDPLADGAISGSGIALENASDVTIDGCEFTKMSIGISVKAKNKGRTQNIEIKNCDFHNYLRWCIDMAPRSSDGVTFSNIRIHHNLFHDYAEYDSANWKGCGEKPHTDGIFMRTAGMGGSTWQGVRIYANEFFNTTTSGGGTACIYISQGPSAMIYNNTFMNTLHGRTIAVMYSPPAGTSPQEVQILNNTFYNNTTAISLRDGTPGRVVKVRNNIFADIRTATSAVCVNLEDGTSDPTELDSNFYSIPSPRQFVLLRNGSYKTLSEVRLNYGWETGTLFGPNGDPAFQDASHAFGANCRQNNLRLKPASPCAGVGASLSSIFTDDKDSVARVVPWTMGAFHLLAPSSAPMPPTDLRVVP
jgi:hypothetical protein